MAEPIEISIRVRISKQPETMEADLIKFLKQYRLSSSIRELIWELVKIHWLPMACAQSRRYRDEEIQELGLNSIALLQKQIVYLSYKLQLPSLGGQAPSEAIFQLPTHGNQTENFSPFVMTEPVTEPVTSGYEQAFVEPSYIDDDF